MIDSFIDNGAIVLALSINNQTNYPRYFCFIKDGRVIKTTTVSDTFSISNPLIIKWKDNFIIQDSSTSVDPNISKPKVFLYSSTGEKILDVVNKNFEIMYDFEIINDFEGIAITENINNHLIWRFDLRKETALWYILTYFPELDRPRFDETKLISKTTTHFTYEISYTEYSGTKGTIKFKVNIETGEVEYL